MRKFLTRSVANVPPLHLNSRNDMSRAYAVRITASTSANSVFCVCFVPTVVFSVSCCIFHFSLISNNSASSISVDNCNGIIDLSLASFSPCVPVLDPLGAAS